MSQVPTIFNEYFKNAIADLCDKLQAQTQITIEEIPKLQNKSQINKHTSKLYELFNITKKELDINFKLLYEMTHESDEKNQRLQSGQDENNQLPIKLDKKDADFQVVSRKKRRNKHH